MTVIQHFIKFKPILKEKIWGGEKLKNYLHKASNQKNIGESWEISDVKGDTSVVENGPLQGKNLQELINEFTSNLVGDKVYQQFGNSFPLLIKFIDAKEALSIQLHPDDVLAKKRHNSFGKTEMWYVVQADSTGNLIVGFSKDVDKEDYLNHLKKKTLTEILNVDAVKEGDLYFIPTGRVHAIGAGVLLAEIQQTSDITYRLYDWDRQDDKGNYRELHTEDALDAIDFKAQDSYKTTYSKQINSSTEIVSCPYFTTNILPVNGTVSINHNDKDSFVIYMCVKGEVEFKSNISSEVLAIGQTILVPASLKEFAVLSKEPAELLEVYIK